MAMIVFGVSPFLSELAVLALRSLVLGGIVAIGLSALQVKSASVRLFAWTAALYASLALPVLAWILPPVLAPVPSVLRHRTSKALSTALPDFQLPAPPEKDVRSHTIRSPEETLPATSSLASVQHLGSAPSHSWKFPSWNTAATWAYFTVSLILVARIVIALIFGNRLLRRARHIGEERIHSQLEVATRGLRLRRLPEIAESGLVSVPVTMGAFHSTIVLPANWREWDSAKWNAVIAHELSHVARHDGLTQRMALLHRAIFWFSPFAWWLNRHVADLAEQASDEVVLSRGTNHNDYARTLLGFLEALHAGPGRVWWQGVAMATPGQTEQRMERILAWRGAVTMNLTKSVAIAIVVLGIPVVYLTASLQAAEQTATAPQPAASARPPRITAPTLAPAPARVPTRALAPAPGSEPVPALAPVAPGPVAAVAAEPVASAGLAREFQADSFAHRGFFHSSDFDDEQRFVIVSGNSDTMTMSGSSEDARHAKKLKRTISGDFIWFERDERSYIIRDQATVARAKKLWAPQEELGKRQEALGKQQEALGKQQEALGKRMEEIRVQVPDMTAEMDKLRAEMKALSSGATQGQIGKLQSEIGELQSKIGEIQSHAGDQQSKLGEEMGALGEQQGKLGEQQGELGRQQGELAEKAAREMKQIFDEAIKNRTAQPEPESRESGDSL
jgi:bla regulator protein BlaR1